MRRPPRGRQRGVTGCSLYGERHQVTNCNRCTQLSLSSCFGIFYFHFTSSSFFVLVLFALKVSSVTVLEYSSVRMFRSISTCGNQYATRKHCLFSTLPSFLPSSFLSFIISLLFFFSPSLLLMELSLSSSISGGREAWLTRPSRLPLYRRWRPLKDAPPYRALHAARRRLTSSEMRADSGGINKKNRVPPLKTFPSSTPTPHPPPSSFFLR